MIFKYFNISIYTALFGVAIIAAFFVLRPATPIQPPEAEFKSVMTTYFFVGEPAGESNDFIPNDVSYWDDQWEAHAPAENTFYFALPYGEFDAEGTPKANVKNVPWYSPDLFGGERQSLLKNHWIEVVHGRSTCFGQWEDVGPNGEDDFAYVFGTSTPRNTFGARAGLDVSPAMWSCLGMEDNATTSWKFVDSADVPSGPWSATVTSSGITW